MEIKDFKHTTGVREYPPGKGILKYYGDTLHSVALVMGILTTAWEYSGERGNLHLGLRILTV